MQKILLKRILPALAAILLLFGCGTKKKAEEISYNFSKGFSCTAAIHFNGMDIKAAVQKTATGLYEIKIIDPQLLDGLSFSLSGGQVVVKYKDIVFDIDSDYFISKSFATDIAGVLDNTANHSNTEFKLENQDIVVSGTSGGASYSVRLDKNTGALKSLAIPSKHISAEFTEFNFL